jgi:predicted esterase
LPGTKVAYVAPQAAGGTWYPNSFLAPLGSNEPGLGSALQAIGDVLRDVEDHGIPSERTVLLGFSQGACLALEFAARNPRRYGGVVGLSGGLIGTGDRAEVPRPDDKLFEYSGSLAGTPVFVACSDPDPHIPLERVRRTAEVLRELGGDVTERIYPGMPHSIKEDELRFVEGLVTKVVDL